MHKTTTDLTRRFGVLSIEDLNVKGMMANDVLSRSTGKDAAVDPGMDVPQCGGKHHRDMNAASNIQYAALATVSWAGRNACGEEGAGRGRKTPVKPALVKQEITHGIKMSWLM